MPATQSKSLLASLLWPSEASLRRRLLTVGAAAFATLLAFRSVRRRIRRRLGGRVVLPVAGLAGAYALAGRAPQAWLRGAGCKQSDVAPTPSDTWLQSWLWPSDASLLRRTVTAGAVTVTALLVIRAVRRRRGNRLPPGPFAWPLVGSVEALTYKGADSYYKLPDELQEKYGQLATLYLGSTPALCVLEPSLVQEALLNRCLSDRMNQMYSIDYFTEGMNSIFAAPNGPRWRFHRKVAYSAFRMFAQGEQLEQFVVNAFDSVAGDIGGGGGGGDSSRDLYELVYLLTYNLQGAMVLGSEFKGDDAGFKKLRNSMETLNQLFLDGVAADFLPILRFLPLPSVQKFHENCNVMLDWANAVCSQHKLAFNPDQLCGILDFLIKEQREAVAAGNGHHFQDVHLRQTLIDIFFAGTDTTAFTMYQCIRALCANPEMQRKCYDEICGVFGPDGTPSCDQRHRLPYCDAFLHEVQRFWALAPMLLRKCNEDTRLGDWQVKTGTLMLIGIVRCHLDESAFPDARRFDPGHFLEADGSLSPYRRGFLPFGAGSRVCLGEAIAKKTTFLLLLLLVQRFRFEWEGDDGSRGISDNSNLFFMMPKRFKATVHARQ